MLLRQAGERFALEGIRTVIVVDGLDHVPREERPTNSLVAELPLPEAVPTGVIFVLGTQRLDLSSLKPAVGDQAGRPERLVRMSPLSREDVARMADTLGLDTAISRLDLSNLTLGHPLATRYLIQALLNADADVRTHLLGGGMPFRGDIETVYTAAWREISSDTDAMDVLGYIARAEAPVDLSLLTALVRESAIERALVVARHLLRETHQGWSVFHNSFRLFVIGQPRTRLGRVDLQYSGRIYRDLAVMAKSAPPQSPQRWLELRYRARAGDHDHTLSLATPARFREQLADGRPIADIHADIHLALLAVRGTYDVTAFTRLLFCRDEIDRRSNALEYASRLPLAMLAVGDVDSAHSFVLHFPERGYDVVDTHLARGDFERAKDLFEALEPLSQLHTSRFQNRGERHNSLEFRKWARRVCHFRHLEQIVTSIDRLAVDGMQRWDDMSSDIVAETQMELRREVAEAMMLHNGGEEPLRLCRQIGVADHDVAAAIVSAGLFASDRGDVARAFELFDAALHARRFDEVPNGLRRRVAMLAAESGRSSMAQALFEKLVAPMIAMCDDNRDLVRLRELVRAVMEHSELCTLLDKPLPPAVPSTRAYLRPIQEHASKLGEMRGQVAKGGAIPPSGSVQSLARMAIGHILRSHASEGGVDAHGFQDAFRAVPALARALLGLAAKCGEDEYRGVLLEIEAVVASSTMGGMYFLRRRLAVDAYRIDGDRVGAVRRLDALAAELHESTPSEQIDGLSDLAIAYSAVGGFDRATQQLAKVPEHCLGYALAPRKDPQYAIWHEVLVRANAADPANRSSRISHLMRQVKGMTETEGVSAAHRLTMPLIDEAIRVDPRFGFEVSRSLTDWGLIGWPNRVDLLLTGMVRRNPAIAETSATVWAALCLPYYKEPHYRDPHHIGDFIASALEVVDAIKIASLAGTLLNAIEVTSRAHERLALLQRLRAAGAARGFSSAELEVAIRRWASEAPGPRHSYTPGKYDSETTLDGLEHSFAKEGDKLGFDAPSRFRALATDAPLERALQMFERWEVLQDDTQSRFMLLKRLAEADDVGRARELLCGYEAKEDPWNSWSQCMGGGKFYHFEAKVVLDGPSVHRTAFENIVDSVISGQENNQALLTELDSILPIICVAPDWPAIWSLLEEQMATTREFQIGQAFEPGTGTLSDVDLLVDLLEVALALPILEVQRHARNGVLRLTAQDGLSQSLVESLMHRLVAGEFDAPLHALRILAATPNANLARKLEGEIAGLVNHRDIAVAESAAFLLRRLDVPFENAVDALPLFYRLDMGEVIEDIDLFRDDRTGAMRLDTPLGWTQMDMLRVAAQRISDASGVDATTIRRRAELFIQEWGGLDAYGKSGVERLESRLRALDMQITYLKPHVRIAFLALRHVAGELHRAGRLSSRHLLALLDQLNTPLPPLPLWYPHVRPEWLPAPVLDRAGDWSRRDQAWVDDVDGDVGRCPLRSDSVVVAEVFRFTIFVSHQAEYRLHRIRTPAAGMDGSDFDTYFDNLPALFWAGVDIALDNHLSSTLIRRRVQSVDCGFDSPQYPIALCPNWLARLGWRVHSDFHNFYVDRGGALVARLVWWRDAGPVDVRADSAWGEGCYLELTQTGIKQFTAAGGSLEIYVFASRHVRQHGGHSKRFVRVATNSYK